MIYLSKCGRVTLLWCQWRERNDRNFEDLERTLEEFKSFYSLYTWTAMFLASLVISFNDFLVLYYPPS
jgi:hypothetical protein